MTNDASVSTLDDLRGRTVYSYGEGGTPEYTIEALLAKNGLEGTFNLEFKSSPLEVLNMMQQQDGCVAILPQPFVSLAKILVNPLYIPIDLTVSGTARSPTRAARPSPPLPSSTASFWRSTSRLWWSI